MPRSDGGSEGRDAVTFDALKEKWEKYLTREGVKLSDSQKEMAEFVLQGFAEHHRIGVFSKARCSGVTFLFNHIEQFMKHEE